MQIDQVNMKVNRISHSKERKSCDKVKQAR